MCDAFLSTFSLLNLENTKILATDKTAGLISTILFPSFAIQYQLSFFENVIWDLQSESLINKDKVKKGVKDAHGPINKERPNIMPCGVFFLCRGG